MSTLTTNQIRTYRTPEHEVDDLFIDRWSPRAMNGQVVTEDTLMSLFEAARWAPSSSNNQPWRFVYALRDTPEWATLFGLLVPNNQTWATRAGALIVIVSKLTFDRNGQPSRTHSYDTGAAWMSLALQGSAKGLVIHVMEGFDYDKARQVLNIPEGYAVEAMAAIGHPGRKEDLPEALQKREFPSPRRPIKEIAFEGTFRPNPAS